VKQSTRFASLVVLAVIIEASLIAMPPSLSALDARLFYGADQALALLAQLGPRGRTEYFKWAGLIAVTIALQIARLRHRTGAR